MSSKKIGDTVNEIYLVFPMATPADAGLVQVGEKLYKDDKDFDRAMLADIEAARAQREGVAKAKAEPKDKAVKARERAHRAINAARRAKRAEAQA